MRRHSHMLCFRTDQIGGNRFDTPTRTQEGGCVEKVSIILIRKARTFPSSRVSQQAYGVPQSPADMAQAAKVRFWIKGHSRAFYFPHSLRQL